MKSQNMSLVRAMYRRLPQSVSSALASEVFSGLGSELSNTANLLLISNRHSDLLNLSINPSSYTDAGTFRDDYLAVSLMSKYPYLNVNIDRASVALESFLIAEKQCSETNFRLSREVSGSIYSPYTPLSIFSLAKLKIASLLGPFSWDRAEQFFGFGPGATTRLTRTKGDAYFKISGPRPHVTKACSILGLCAIKRIPGWFLHLAGFTSETPDAFSNLSPAEQAEKIFEIVPGNRVTTVPKSAKTDRVIAIEPDLNMFIQKGIGALIRSALKRVGIDLDDQTRNQVLAREGSITGTLCTIDLSSASDTISMKLVEELLPCDWFEAIKQCRSPVGTLPDGTVIRYQKVSSMGNGFTFELESLIFWALCSSVITLFKPEESRLAVYGDDIIMASSLYHTISWVLSYAGFTVNMKKSHHDGPFRESCGKHYWKGDDVTPLYIREDIKTPDRLIWFCNSIRRWARLTYGLDYRLKKAYDLGVSLLPSCLQKPRIPDTLGDMALFGDFDEVRPHRSKRYQIYEVVGMADVKATFVPGDYPYLLSRLYSLEKRRSAYMDGASLGVKSNSPGRRWKCIKLPVARWESYGPWLAP